MEFWDCCFFSNTTNFTTDLILLPIVHYDYKRTNRKPRRRCVLGPNFLADHALQGLSVFSELLDPLVEFVECHLVLKKRPAEVRLIVDIRDFGNRFSLRSGLCVKSLRNWVGAVLELLEKCRSDSEKVTTRE